MAKIINIAGRNACIGMEWVSLPGKKRHSIEVAQAAKKGKSAYIVTSTAPLDGTVVGCAQGVKAKQAETAVSLSLWIASLYHQGVVILALPDVAAKEQYFATYIENKLVKSEVVGDIDAIQAFAEECNAFNEKPVTVGPSGLAEHFDVFTYKEVNTDTLLANANPSGAALTRAPKTGNPKGLIKAVAAVGIIGLTGYMAYVLYPEPEPVPVFVPQVTAPKLSPEMLRQQKVQKHLLAVGSELSASMPNPDDLWSLRLRDFIYNLPLKVDGYKLSSILCDKSASCDFKYRRDGFPNVRGFQERYHLLSDEILFPVDGLSAWFTTVFDERLSDLTLGTVQTQEQVSAQQWAKRLEQTPTARDFYRELLIRFLELEKTTPSGWSRSVKDPKVIDVSTQAKDVPLFYQGGVSIRLTEIWLLPTVLNLLENDYTHLTSIGFDTNSDETTTIQLEFHYVVSTPN